VSVLIVDDQAPFRAVARTLVSMISGWDVVAEAETGEKAVEQAHLHAPRLVLMDINLPGISGIEATKQIVTADPTVKVALISTYAGDDLPADAMTSGAVAYYRKEDLTPRVLRGLFESP
jgi:DNA-binding NarL/FixJ family response regulator